MFPSCQMDTLSWQHIMHTDDLATLLPDMPTGEDEKSLYMQDAVLHIVDQVFKINVDDIESAVLLEYFI